MGEAIGGQAIGAFARPPYIPLFSLPQFNPSPLLGGRLGGGWDAPSRVPSPVPAAAPYLSPFPHQIPSFLRRQERAPAGRPHSCLRRNDERGGAGMTVVVGSCLRRNDGEGGAGMTVVVGSCLRRNDERGGAGMTVVGQE